ncbi:MAG: 2-amino-4-hydroxy-6-hydroxymethyldihydropteridine diphosphokinase [Parvibaculales bacterium]
MILIAVGSNLPNKDHSSNDIIGLAQQALARRGVRVIQSSSIYQTPPMGPPNQPDYLNAVWQVSSVLTPQALLQLLHQIEVEFGRLRQEKWGARSLDLDLLDWHGHIHARNPKLPHPGIFQRPFVLVPLREIAPHWRHPVFNLTADALLRKLPLVERLAIKKIN